MEETQNNVKNEIDISDSWTLVNNDDSDEGSINAGPGEPSDSESVEVLEDEQADQEDNFPQSYIERENDCCNGSTITDSNDSCVYEAADIPIASVQKVRKYVHHPSAYINLWLSIVMVIAVAITLGLGIGHYLGSKRYSRARDIINHLKYENQLLERELANAVVKHKYCNSNVRDRVRYLKEKSNQFILSNRFCCKKSILQDLIFGNLTHRDDENVCYADENPFGRQFKKNNLNKTLPIFLQWLAFVNAGDEQNPLHSNHVVFGPSRSFFSTKLTKGDASLVENSFPKLLNISDKISQKSQVFVFKLNNQLTYLYSLFTKWGEFRENLESQVNVHQINNHVGVQMMPVHDIANQSQTHVSETSDKNFGVNTNNMSVVSSNGYCRLKLNQCILCEENRRSQKSKCRALPKIQLLCSILIENKKRSKVFANKSWKRNNNEMRKYETQRFSFKNKNIKRAKELVSSNENSSVVMDSNFWLHKIIQEPNHTERQEKIHLRNRSQNKNKTSKFMKEKERNNSYIHKYSTSDHRKLNKKSKGKKFSQKEKNKNYLGQSRNFIKNEKRKEKDEKVYRREKISDNQPHKRFQHESNKLSKSFKNNYKKYKNVNSKKFVKNNHKKQEIKGKKRDYTEKSKSVKIWNKQKVKSFEKLYSKRKNAKFCMNPRHLDGYQIHSAHLKLGYSENCHYRTEKNHYKNKNFSENAYFKCDADKYPISKNLESYWKERSRTQMNVQTMKVYKS